MKRTIYIWDLADTLFIERWDAGKSGFATMEAYLKSIGKTAGQVTPFEYETAQADLYKKALLIADLAPGFFEILNFTKNNVAFTTGTKEQIVYRAEQIKQKYGRDILPLFKKIITTFDYEPSNIKNLTVYKKLAADLAQTSDILVYADNHLGNCQNFITACKDKGLPFRCHHITNDDGGLKKFDGFWQAGRLTDVLTNEQNENRL
jgi:hypothetical protein